MAWLELASPSLIQKLFLVGDMAASHQKKLLRIRLESLRNSRQVRGLDNGMEVLRRKRKQFIRLDYLRSLLFMLYQDNGMEVFPGKNQGLGMPVCLYQFLDRGGDRYEYSSY